MARRSPEFVLRSPHGFHTLKGGPSALGLINFERGYSASPESLHRDLDAMLNNDTDELVEDEPEPPSANTDNRRPRHSLLDKQSPLEVGGDDRGPSSYSSTMHCFTSRVTYHIVDTYYNLGGRRIWPRKSAFRIPFLLDRFDYEVPHFEFGIAYPPQEPLVDRSKRTGDEISVRDLVYEETINHPEIYPQDSLLEAGRLESSLATFSHALSLISLPSLSRIVNVASSRSESNDAHNEGEPVGEMGMVEEEEEGLDQMQSEFCERIAEGARNALFEKQSHLPAFGEVKEEDMPEIKVDDVLRWLTNKVSNTHRCILCRIVNLNITSIESEGKDGGQGRHLNRPTIVKHTEWSEGEAAPLIPSFNRMVLNCRESACSQCWFFLRILIAGFGPIIFEDDTVFDREALIQCCLTPPIGTLEQYTNLLSEELQKPSPRPVPAPVLAIRPPHKREYSAFSPFREISLLIEKKSLPLPDMQGGGELINSNGVDLA
ncbi:hypothetical protein F4824DRAFT_503901 [Ustulina deusta]|nr:hypothetical protein F4824DRAFT_503901 [Ustulina deusta]